MFVVTDGNLRLLGYMNKGDCEVVFIFSLHIFWIINLIYYFCDVGFGFRSKSLLSCCYGYGD